MTNIEKQKLLGRFCNLSGYVVSLKFNGDILADCFCGRDNHSDNSFLYDKEIIKFIEDAVFEKLEQK